MPCAPHYLHWCAGSATHSLTHTLNNSFTHDSLMPHSLANPLTHSLTHSDDYQMDHLRLSSADKALRGLKAAQGLLLGGFTTVRTAGDADAAYPSFSIAKSIAAGVFQGPRIVGAGHYISVTGDSHSLTHSLTRTLTHTHLLYTYALTQSHTHSLKHSRTHSLSHSLTHSLTHSLKHSLTYALTRYYMHTDTYTIILELTMHRRWRGFKLHCI